MVKLIPLDLGTLEGSYSLHLSYEVTDQSSFENIDSFKYGSFGSQTIAVLCLPFRKKNLWISSLRLFLLVIPSLMIIQRFPS